MKTKTPAQWATQQWPANARVASPLVRGGWGSHKSKKAKRTSMKTD
jgi:hypothetical protein